MWGAAAVASEKVVAAPADTARPQVTVIGIADEAAFQIRVSDDRGIAASTAIESGDLVFNSGRGAATLGAITPPGFLVDTDGEPVKAATRTVAVSRGAGAGGAGVGADVVVAGDRLRLSSGAVVDTSVGSAPGTTVRYEMTTASTAYMPQARDLVDIAAGHTGAGAIAADATAGNAAHPAITAVPAVATGCAPDAPTRLNATTINNSGAQDRVDEDKNGASQPRITVSASVKARN